MIVVIIAGGSGTRLWPLSTPDFPKHLLKVNGDGLSLLQQTYKRAKQLTQHIYIVSEAGHINHVKEQLPDLADEAFIVEPGRRGTANCIILALSIIGQQHESDEAVAFMHADHYIRDTAGFTYSFRLAKRVAVKERKIVLVGVEPVSPSTGFGYIEKGDVLDEQSLVFQVRSFKEKPDYQTAKIYFRSGNYLWNGGYFVGTLTTFLDSMKQYSPELAANYRKLAVSSGDIDEAYLDFKPEAIDYALIEKVPDLLMVPAAFDWMDLGSFGDLAKVVNGDENGNYMHGDRVEIDEVKNSFMYNSENKPVAVIGLDNVVVVNTPDGLLVARKDLSQKVGEVSKRLNDQETTQQ